MAAIVDQVGQIDLYAPWPGSRLWCHRFHGGRERPLWASCPVYCRIAAAKAGEGRERPGVVMAPDGAPGPLCDSLSFQVGFFLCLESSKL